MLLILLVDQPQFVVDQVGNGLWSLVSARDSCYKADKTVARSKERENTANTVTLYHYYHYYYCEYIPPQVCKMKRGKNP